MKIAVIVHGFPKLSETFILNQITGLIDLGHTVDIFAYYKPKEKKVHADIKDYALLNHVKYFSFIHNGVKDNLRLLFSLMLEFCFHPVRFLSSISVFKKWWKGLLLTAITTLFSGKQYDIVHCHFGPNGIIGMYLRKMGVRSKFVTTFYGYDLSQFILRYGNGVYSELFRNGDVFLSISEYFQRKLISLGCNPKEIIVHHLGIDLNRFKQCRERDISPKGEVKILTVGRLHEMKGYEYAIKAIARVVEGEKKILYIIAGDGAIKNKLRSLASQLKVSSFIQFLGEVTQEEVMKLYKEAHIFMLSSATSQNGNQEGTPTVLMEAQAMELPVVSTYHSGIPEVVIDGKTGYLVIEKDIVGLANKIEFLVENPAMWSTMGRYGREVVEDKYNINKLNRQLVDIYQALVKQ